MQEYEEPGRNLPSIIEYEKIGRKLTGMRKIDGHFYHFRYESMNKNKHYPCIERNTRRCRGSITITPNNKIVKKAYHMCKLIPS